MTFQKPRVLIAHPDPKDPGGVARFFGILEPFSAVEAHHFINGRRPDEGHNHFSLLRLVADYLRFTGTLIATKYDIVHLNPSLNRKGVLRDAVFILLGKHLFRRKMVVFFHGWELDYAERLKGWKLSLFCFIFRKADATLVLAQDFKETLLRWGFEERRIHVETTAFAKTLTEGFDIENAIAARRKGSFDILFFARLIRSKGIYETLETFALLSREYPRMRLLIAGDGPEFAGVKAFIEKANLRQVILAGYIRADQKKKLLTQSSLLFLPSYTEGFPIAVVEAMAVGLPVVTRTVGGIRDFFVQRGHGFTTETKDPEVFARMIRELFERQDLHAEISRANYQYAREHFAAPEVRRRLETIYTGLWEGGKNVVASRPVYREHQETSPTSSKAAGKEHAR